MDAVNFSELLALIGRLLLGWLGLATIIGSGWALLAGGAHAKERLLPRGRLELRRWVLAGRAPEEGWRQATVPVHEPAAPTASARTTTRG